MPVESAVVQLLRFRIGNDIFALPVERVVQIIERRPVTRVPGVAASIAGVFNYDGRITPAVDLAAKLRIERDDNARRTCIVIVAAKHDAEDATVGLLVDA
ncbi:MAG TPA: chemotaxis protein CheW, partial [Thermoanaerobaculia bacterium]|nr:chemotaxis protein CheW [Thermoanaerobaculia bacterium]